jgi:ketosteroid isomerase-like protein
MVSPTPLLTATPTASPGAVVDTFATTSAAMQAWATGWSTEDPDLLSPLYAEDVRGYDADEPGWSWNKVDAEEMLRDPGWWANFDVGGHSYFVTADGRFAAALATFTAPVAGRDRVPAASVVAFRNGRIVWNYDYYGGVASSTESMLAFPPSVADAASPDAQAAVAETTATLEAWLAAFNGRDAEAFLAAYADGATYIDVVGPEWRVMDRTELAADVAAHFPRAEFATRLEPPAGSPVDPYLVSADGRFAAVQGTYQDQGISDATPMVVFVEMREGRIVRQYNLMLVDRDLLQP